MRRFLEWPRPVLLALTCALLGAAALYSLFWMFLASRALPLENPSLLDRISVGIILSNPLWFLVVASLVLLARRNNAQAWLLALVYAGAIAAPPLNPELDLLPGGLSSFLVIFRGAFFWLIPALFYCFFAVFPQRSPLDQTWPRLKIFFFLPGIYFGSSYALSVFTGRLENEWAWSGLETLYFVIPFTMGLVSLAGNYWSSATEESRRRLRVILWGTVIGVPPTMLMLVAKTLFSAQPPLWLDAIPYLASYFLPLSFGYAVMVHRALGFPTLLRRSARYFLVQRGFAVLLLLVSAGITFAVADLYSHHRQIPVEGRKDPGVAFGVVLGGAMIWAGISLQNRFRQRIDRAFFRSVYNTQQVLQELARMIRTASTRQELAILLENKINQALHPKHLTIYLELSGTELIAVRGRVVRGMETLSSALPAVKHASRLGRPWDVPSLKKEDKGQSFPSLGEWKAECLVPILTLERRLIGLVVLGPRRSEEPYSGEDKNLLELVASQAGTALENMALAEQMAQRLEIERRTAFEMDIARQVQSKLLPQTHPAVENLDYAGLCIQTRAVGGDYYDFLRLDQDRLGLVLADIAGKGLHAALLMAHLQANLRSQYAAAREDLSQLLRSVNTLFYDSTEPQHYATFFFGDYDAVTHRLRYSNCGHNPPLLLRGNGTPEWLAATGMVLGIFRDWEPGLHETSLEPGDILVLYSDGVSEASSDAGIMFGEGRLAEVVKACKELPAAEMVQRVAGIVQDFSGAVQEDDLTLVIARAC